MTEARLEVIGEIQLGEALAAWALHEWKGRYHAQLGDIGTRLSDEQTRLLALRLLLDVRRDVIAGMVTAGITGCVTVRVVPKDIPAILVMGADPATNYSRNKLAEIDTDGSADYVRQLAARTERVEGPFLAIARTTAGPITIFDGMHRIAAWVAHVGAGRAYPLQVNLVLTERPSPVFELRPIN